MTNLSDPLVNSTESTPTPGDTPLSFQASTDRQTGVHSAGRSRLGEVFIRPGTNVIQGRVEGTIEIGDLLTVAAGADVRAQITARNLEVQGRIEGQVEAAETVRIRKDGEIIGDIRTAGLVIEEGGYIKGAIDLTLCK